MAQPTIDEVASNVSRMISDKATDKQVGDYLRAQGHITREEMNSRIVPILQQRPTGIEATPAPWAGRVRDFLATYVRPGAEVAGSEAARVGALGAAAPTMTGAELAAGGATTLGTGTLTANPLLIAVGAGALGYAAVKSLFDYADTRLAEIEYGEPVKQLRDPSMMEGFVQGLRSLKEGLQLELFGYSAGNLIERGLGHFVQKPKTELEKVAERQGQKLTKYEQTGKRGLSLVETIAEKAPSSADIMADMRFQQQLAPLMKTRAELLGKGTSEEQLIKVGNKIYTQINSYLRNVAQVREDAIEGLRTDLLAKLGSQSDLTSLGLRGKEAIAVANKAARERATQAYLRSGEAFGLEQNIPTPNLNRYASSELTERLKLPAQDSKFLGRLKWAASSADTVPPELEKELALYAPEVRERIIQQLQTEGPLTPQNIKNWQTLVAFDQELGALARQSDALKTSMPGQIAELSNIGRIYREMQDSLRLDMEAAAQAAGGDTWQQYQLAKAFYRRRVVEVFKTDIIRSLYKSDPEKLVDAAFKPNGITEIATIRRALKDNPGAFVELRQGFTNKLLGVNTGAEFNPAQFARNLNRYGEGMLTDLYGVEGYATLRRAASSKTTEGILASKAMGESYLIALTRPGSNNLNVIVDDIIGTMQRPNPPHQLLKNLGTVRDVVDRQTFNDLGEIFLDRIFRPEEATGFIDPVRLSNDLRKYDKVLRLWYGRDKFNTFQDLVKIGARQKSASRLARDMSERETLAAWTTLGVGLRTAAAGVAGAGALMTGTGMPISGTMLASGGGLVLGPYALAKLYLSENGLRFLREASRTPATSAKATELTTKILAIVNAENTRLERSRKTQQYGPPKRQPTSMNPIIQP